MLQKGQLEVVEEASHQVRSDPYLQTHAIPDAGYAHTHAAMPCWVLAMPRWVLAFVAMSSWVLTHRMVLRHSKCSHSLQMVRGADAGHGGVDDDGEA